jgi:hypothetical protein
MSEQSPPRVVRTRRRRFDRAAERRRGRPDALRLRASWGAHRVEIAAAKVAGQGGEHRRARAARARRRAVGATSPRGRRDQRSRLAGRVVGVGLIEVARTRAAAAARGRINSHYGNR